MPILALDTATLVSSVALATEDALVAEITIQTKKTHSERLMSNIAQLLSMAEVDKSDLSGIAVSIGPGSFTGLRIGLATAKALAYGLSIPLVGVPTLAAIAYNYPVPGVTLSPMLDAQKGNVYQSLYIWDSGQLQEIQASRVVSIETALQELAQCKQPAVIMGEAAILHKEKIRQACSNIILAEPCGSISRAGSVAILGCKLLKNGVSHDVAGLEPLYIRRSEAEELWERRHGGAS